MVCSYNHNFKILGVGSSLRNFCGWGEYGPRVETRGYERVSLTGYVICCCDVYRGGSEFRFFYE
jgi:hypothetical protein